jgi:hypothetical protein
MAMLCIGYTALRIKNYCITVLCIAKSAFPVRNYCMGLLCTGNAMFFFIGKYFVYLLCIEFAAFCMKSYRYISVYIGNATLCITSWPCWALGALYQDLLRCCVAYLTLLIYFKKLLDLSDVYRKTTSCI